MWYKNNYQIWANIDWGNPVCTNKALASTPGIQKYYLSIKEKNILFNKKLQ